jgi:hypothetical protein
VSLIGASFFKQKCFSDSGELQRKFQLTVLLVHHALKDSNSRWPGQALRAPANSTAGTLQSLYAAQRLPSNIPIVVEACTNLANPVWTPLQTLTPSSDPQLKNHPGRYYRNSLP